MSNIRLQCVDGSGNPIFLVNNSGIVTASTAQLTDANITTQTVGTSRITTSIIATGNSNTIGSLISTGGNIGIGITPNARLDVAATSESSGALVAQFGGSSTSRILFYDHSNIGVGAKIAFNSGNPTPIEAGGHINLNPLGSFTPSTVGIRTTSPAYKLDANGTISIRNGDLSDTFNKNQIVFGYNGTNSYAHAIKTRHHDSINGSNNAMDFYVWQTSNSASTVGNKHIMSITSQGVGIGTQYPSNTLHAKTTIGNTIIAIDTTSGSQGLFEFYRDGTRKSTIYKPANSDQLRVYMDGIAGEILTFETNGNVGIRNNSPQAGLDIATSNTFGQLFLGNTVQNRKIVLWNGATNDHVFNGIGVNAGVLRYQVNDSSNDHIFYAAASASSSTELMRIKGNGRIGIGTASPTCALDVWGDIAIPYGNAICQSSWANQKLIEVQSTGTFDQTRIYAPGAQGGGDTPKLVIQNNGYVGINTTSPTSEFDVRGGDAIMGWGGAGLVLPLVLTNYTETSGSAMGMTMGQGNQWTRMYDTNVDSNTNRFSIDMTANNTTNTNVLTATNNSAGTIYVGINTSSPQYTLDVAGVININGFALRNISAFGYLTNPIYGVGLSGSWGASSNVDYSLYASQRIAATEFNAYSDERIKKDIQDITDSSALEKIRAIQPKRYKYIDTVSRGETPVWGFIAQQVASVLDYSTNKITTYIPNVYKRVNVIHNTGGSILSSESLDTSVLDLTHSDEIDREGNSKLLKIRIFVDKGEQDSMLEVFVKQIISTTEIQIEELLESDITEAFFYGQRINDFHTLNKDAIFTVSVAALQEVDRQLQTTKEKIIERQQKIDTLNQQIQDILARIVTLN